MNKIFNTAFFLTVLAFLSMIPQQLSAQLVKDLNTGSIVLDDQTLEIKKEVVGGGTIDLIDGTTERVDGICSFDKNKLQTGRAFVFDQIAINYATDAASGKEGELAYNTAAPAALQNAIFILSQDGRVVFSAPVRDLTNILTGQKASDAYTQLKSLRYFADDRTITMQIKFPPGVSLSNAAKHYVYVRLNGLQTSKKGNA
ncbi:hypothetical protein [Flavobacterium sp.]|uniref:hypothetical protein n=1 Tax=Flavobacterium sp. TaxID=239 RepID=UPI00391CBBB4